MLFGGNIEKLYSFDTCQFEDYSKVVSDCFNPEMKAKRHKEVFPNDLKQAFELGARLANASQ